MASFGRSEGPGVASGLLGAILIAGGVAMAGWFIGGGLSFSAPREAAREATLRGAAEREVVADLALWSFNLVAAGPDVTLLQADIDARAASVTAYLQAQGLDEAEFVFGPLDAIDLAADPARTLEPARRFILRQPVSVRSANVERVATASLQLSQLLTETGVVAVEADGPHYVFTGLAALRDDLESEAFADARAAAERFAREADARLGDIAAGEAGPLVIEPRDLAPGDASSDQILQRVRLEAEITYRLN